MFKNLRQIGEKVKREKMRVSRRLWNIFIVFSTILWVVSILFGITGTVLGIIATVRLDTHVAASSDTSETNVYTLPSHAIKIDDSTYQASYPELGVHATIMISWPKNETHLKTRVSPTESDSKHIVHDQCLGNIHPNTRWRTVEDYIVDTRNSEGLPASFISSAANIASSTWNSYLAFKPFGRQRLGNLAGGTSFTGQNGLTFGAIDISGATHAIAVTVVYWVCGSVCSYVEWKQIYNTVNYHFGSGIGCSGGVVDTTNTMMHEFGHSIGNVDLTDPACSEDTMFGTEGYCERKKITLEDDDIYNARFVIGYGDSGSLRAGASTIHDNVLLKALTYALIVTYSYL